jgi:hypothetical protein
MAGVENDAREMANRYKRRRFFEGLRPLEYKESGFPDGGHNAAHVIGRGLRARRRSLFSTGARRSDAPRRPPAHISSSIMA